MPPQGDPTTWTRDMTPKSFFNPLSDEVIVDYRHENNLVDKISIPPIKVSTYPTYLAEHLIKHLVDAIINDRELGYVTPEKRAEIEQEVVEGL